MRAANGAPESFLRAHAAYGGDDCLIWPFGKSSDGYGIARIGGVRKQASRWMCVLAHGEPPSPDHDAAHSCGRGHLGCVNPRHLRWATRVENVDDCEIHGTMSRGERHGCARLSDRDVIAIRADARPQRAIAADYGVSQSAVSRARNRKLWAHVS